MADLNKTSKTLEEIIAQTGEYKDTVAELIKELDALDGPLRYLVRRNEILAKTFDVNYDSIAKDIAAYKKLAIAQGLMNANYDRLSKSRKSDPNFPDAFDAKFTKIKSEIEYLRDLANNADSEYLESKHPGMIYRGKDKLGIGLKPADNAASGSSYADAMLKYLADNDINYNIPDEVINTNMLTERIKDEKARLEKNLDSLAEAWINYLPGADTIQYYNDLFAIDGEFIKLYKIIKDTGAKKLSELYDYIDQIELKQGEGLHQAIDPDKLNSFRSEMDKLKDLSTVESKDFNIKLNNYMKSLNLPLAESGKGLGLNELDSKISEIQDYYNKLTEDPFFELVNKLKSVKKKISSLPGQDLVMKYTNKIYENIALVEKGEVSDKEASKLADESEKLSILVKTLKASIDGSLEYKTLDAERIKIEKAIKKIEKERADGDAEGEKTIQSFAREIIGTEKLLDKLKESFSEVLKVKFGLPQSEINKVINKSGLSKKAKLYDSLYANAANYDKSNADAIIKYLNGEASLGRQGKVYKARAEVYNALRDGGNIGGLEHIYGKRLFDYLHDEDALATELDNRNKKREQRIEEGGDYTPEKVIEEKKESKTKKASKSKKGEYNIADAEADTQAAIQKLKELDTAREAAAEAAKQAEEERARLAAEAAESEQKEKEAIEAKAKAEEEHRKALEREKKAQEELAKATAEANKAAETGSSTGNSEYADNIKAAQEEAAKASEDLARSKEAVKQATENAARASEAAVNAKKAEADATENVKKANDDLTEATKKLTDAKTKNVETSKSETKSANEILAETKRYVSDQEALTNRKMPFAEQVKYYEEQLKKLKYGSREYIEVLKMMNAAENAAVKESKANRDKVISTIKSISGAINNAVNKIISIIRSGISIINKVVSTAGNIVTRVVSGVRRIIQVFGSLSNRVRQSLGIANSSVYGGNKALNLLKGTATELDSKLNLLSRAYNAVFNNQLINDARELQASVYSLQNIVGKEQTQEVIDWANAYEYAFGLSAKQLIADINELTGVLYGLGIKSEHVGVASENILVASRYLAFMGAAGSDTDKVMEKLLSGLKGMTQSIDDLGISVRSAQMDTFLKKLKDQGGEFANIGTSFENLNEEARIYVRYASIIDQITSKYDLTRFTGALTTTTGSLSLLKETVNTLRLTVGVGLNNIIAKLSTYIIPLVSYVNDLIVRIFSHFGIDTKLSTNINKGVDAFGNISGEADKAKDSLDAVSEASKKAGGNLQSFDRINNVTTSKSGSGSGSDGFDYSKLFTSGIDKLNKLAFEAQESYMDRLKKKLKDDTASLINEIKSRLNDITGREINLGFDMATIRGNLKSIFNHIKDTLKTWGTFVINIGVKIADDMNLGLIITKLSTLIERFTALGRTVAEVVTPILDRFYENTLKPIFESLGISAVGIIDKLILKTTEAENTVLSADWSESFSNTLDSLFTKVEQFFGVLTRTKSETVLDETAGTSWGLFLSVLDAFLQVGEALAPIISDLAKEFGAFLRDEALPWFIEKLEDLSVWLTENKEKIEEFLRMYGGAAWKAFKMFVEIVGNLIAFCVEHPKEVAAFFTALVSIKIASWATNSAASLIQLFNTFTKFNATKLGAKIFGGKAAEAATDVLGLPGGTAAGTAGKGIFKTLGTTASKFLRKAAGTKAGHLLLGTTGGGLALTAAGIAGLKYDFNNISDYKKVDEKQKLMEAAGLKAIEEGNYALAEEYSKKIDIMEDIQNDITKRPKQALDEEYVDKLYQQWAEEQDLLAEQEQVRKENGQKLLEYNNNVTKSAKDTSNSVVQAYSTVPSGVDKSFSTAATGAKDQLNSIPGAINSNAVAAQYSSLPANVEAIFANTKLAANSQTDGIKTNTASGCKAMTNTFLAYNTAVKTIIESTNRTVNKNFDSINKRADEVLKKYQSLGLISPGGSIGSVGSYKSRFSGLSFNTSTFVPKEKTSTFAEKVDTAKENTKTRFSFSNTLVNNAYDDTRNRIYARHSQSVLGSYAVGGSIAGGQLFIANEGGEAELIGNIDGTRKTNVANNNMIMEAMSNGVYEAVYNALAEILNQRGFNNNAGSANIRIDGFGLIDQSTLRELARLLAPYLSSNSINIADTGFSI